MSNSVAIHTYTYIHTYMHSAIYILRIFHRYTTNQIMAILMISDAGEMTNSGNIPFVCPQRLNI